MKPVRIMTVDDHPLLREGLAAVLQEEPGLELVAEAGSGEEAVAFYRQLRPDLTFMDLLMPGMGGIAAITAIREEYPQARFIVLTTYRGDMQAWRAIRAGAQGYMLKNDLRNDIGATIAHVMNGGRIIPDEIAQDMALHTDDNACLSAREAQVMTQVANGETNRAIASRFGIAEETVKVHIRKILAKLRAKDRTHAVAIAIRRGFIDR